MFPRYGLSRGGQVAQRLHLARRKFREVGFLFPQEGDRVIINGALRAMHERFDRRKKIVLRREQSSRNSAT